MLLYYYNTVPVLLLALPVHILFVFVCSDITNDGLKFG